MNIKKHYKIFIAILIIIILISSFIVYDITPKNNINYNNNGEHVDVKYYSNPDGMPYIPENYNASSSYLDNNKVSYMNSTIINPCYWNSALHSGLNMHLKNVNAKYIYIYFGGLSQYPCHGSITNAKIVKNTNIKSNYELKIKIDSNNITLNRISMRPLHTGSNHYVSIKIALNNNFYNTFDISSIKETAIYGTVLIGNISSLYIENLNTTTYHIVKVINGYCYFFAKPYTEYEIYYLHNNSLNKFYYINNGNVSQLNSLNTTSPGSSKDINIYTSIKIA